MDFQKIVKFRIGSEDWEIPLGILLLLLAITLLLMIGGAYMGFKFGERQFSSEETVGMAGSLFNGKTFSTESYLCLISNQLL